MNTITLDHEFSAGHRIVGHMGRMGQPGKCARLHGHNYRVHVELGALVLDSTGFVVDFADIKRLIDAWDHRTILWEKDPLAACILVGGATPRYAPTVDDIVRVGFNPTAENMADDLCRRLLGLSDRINHVIVTVFETERTQATQAMNRADLLIMDRIAESESEEPTRLSSVPWPVQS